MPSLSEGWEMTSSPVHVAKASGVNVVVLHRVGFAPREAAKRGAAVNPFQEVRWLRWRSCETGCAVGTEQRKMETL